MQRIASALLSPLVFAIGFIWPLVAQASLALGLVTLEWQALLIGALVAVPLGLMAQLRGSWIWIK